MEPNDLDKPVIRGRASIVECELTIKVLWRNQLQKLITYLIENDYEFQWEKRSGDSITHDEYYLTVGRIHWAKNLTRICKELEKCDYQEIDDNKEEE